ncbi:MAG: FAD-dependent oxidoreductase [Verrucomicrobia bacterium]|nr:FAD-dependent oxidoreductase [Verrucomicrobiota bacterium]MBS0637190.1 FAD-dependent oxidoreductase [Verrucomicrobiota bacterium]
MAASLPLAGTDMEEVVIVGAGVAGLACMNAFLDKGIYPILYEAGTVGSYKICGEFLSARACRQLEAWDISPIQKIDQIHIDSLTIDVQCGAMSRIEAELKLAARAKKLDGRIVEETKVEQLLPGKVLLADGQEIATKKLIVATGRFGAKPAEFPYIGLKAHFTHDQLIPSLTMQLIQGGYYGIVPISATTSNIACLVKKEYLQQALNILDVEWHTAPVGSFGIKKVPNWPNCYWIGDAIASFPPATGQGFTHALDSALLAASSQQPALFFKMHLSKLIHELMLRPTAARAAIPLVRCFKDTLCNTLVLN